MRELIATRQFEKDISRIPSDIVNRADDIVVKLRKNPVDPTLEIRKLSQIQPSTYRIRIRNYRLIYSFTETSVILHRMRHRKDVYRKH